ncbi:C-type lectin domain family 1 member A-like [Tachyglossus aculeatus]|uniref:C-type lectin domain family 1 member A-like n=1 Tax=Tachyglossus aculeatus TaxID=9261 RepID=UPI0018F5B8B3|nr:C-type lectin domain family 1 member A-like [Tachyglossus aculeatus]
MQDEDGYTVLNISKRPFSQGSALTGKDPPVHSHVWRPLSLLLLTLCLLQLIGLVVLGIKFSQARSQEIGGTSSPNDKPENLDINGSCSKQQEFLLSQNSKLSAGLRKMAIELCREVTRNKPESKCSPCGKGWQWSGDSCYRKFDIWTTWPKGKKICHDNNSTLVKVDSREELNFISEFKDAWLGLSFNGSRRSWLWEDGSALRSDLISITEPYSGYGNNFCAFQHSQIRSADCLDYKYSLCETVAGPVRAESLY